MTTVESAGAHLTAEKPGQGGRHAQDRGGYFLAAYALLAEGGRSSVTVPALCGHLGVTKGSFYHHFGAWTEFVASFARSWRDWLIGLMDAYDAEPDPRRRLELLCNTHLVAINGAEPAIRAWALTDPSLAAAVREVDNHGLRFTARVSGQLIEDPPASLVPSVLAIAVSVGLQQRMGRVEPGSFARMTAKLFTRLLGVQTEVVQADYGPALRVLSLGRPSTSSARAPGPISELEFTAAPNAPGPRAVRRPESGIRERLTAEGFLATARQMLHDDGYEAVSVPALCETLGVTKGSFHHHFAGFNDLVERMAQRWEEPWQDRFRRCAATPSPLLRLELLCQPLLYQPDPADTAWHAWGWSQPVIARAVERVEQELEDLVTAALVDLQNPPDVASALAAMTVALGVGLRQRQPPLPPGWLHDAVLTWCRDVLRLDARLAHGPAPRIDLLRPKTNSLQIRRAGS